MAVAVHKSDTLAEPRRSNRADAGSIGSGAQVCGDRLYLLTTKRATTPSVRAGVDGIAHCRTVERRAGLGVTGRRDCLLFSDELLRLSLDFENKLWWWDRTGEWPKEG